jgi:MFS family permease
MDNPYRTIFRPHGTFGFASAGFIARLPVAMAPIGIVTMLSEGGRGYWLAGAVAATFTLLNALAAPQISRIVDRVGQFRVLLPTVAIAVCGFALMMCSARMDWPSYTLFMGAVLAAAMPSISAMVRARWSALFRDTPELGTAFAFESAADEMVYIAGASLSVGLSVALFPEAGVFVSTLLLAAGSAALAVQRGSEPAVAAEGRSHGAAAILYRPVQVISLVMVLVGTIFATAEVSTVALTREFGSPESASWVIAGYAAGSFLVGLILGSLKLTFPLSRQLLFCTILLFVTTVPLLFANSVALLAAAIFVSGIAVSPTFITAFGLVEQRVPAAVLTEGITWVGTGIGIGMAVGAFVSGLVVDEFGAASGFWVSLCAAAAAFTVTAVGQKWLVETPR